MYTTILGQQSFLISQQGASQFCTFITRGLNQQPACVARSRKGFTELRHSRTSLSLVKSGMVGQNVFRRKTSYAF